MWGLRNAIYSNQFFPSECFLIYIYVVFLFRTGDFLAMNLWLLNLKQRGEGHLTPSSSLFCPTTLILTLSPWIWFTFKAIVIIRMFLLITSVNKQNQRFLSKLASKGFLSELNCFSWRFLYMFIKTQSKQIAKTFF